MGEDERKLYVGNLPVDIAQAEVQEVFGLYGTIAEVHINVPKDGGRNFHIRSAFVRFEESQDAAAAMAVLSDMYKFRENVAPLRINYARPAYGMPGGKASGGKGYGETGGYHGGWDAGSGGNGAAANGIAAAGGDASAAGIPAPPPVAAPPPPAAVNSRPAGGHPMTAPPPPAPPSSNWGAPPNGGGNQWGDGYGRAQSNGRPDATRQWGTGTYSNDTGGHGGGGGGKDPFSGRDLGSKLWVGNLPADITPQQLEDVFKQYGKVEDVSILPNKSRSGQVCAFVHYASPSQADACVQAMSSGYELRPGEGELKVERPGSRKGGYGDKGKGGKRGYQPY